jgi:hypothetical protein
VETQARILHDFTSQQGLTNTSQRGLRPPQKSAFLQGECRMLGSHIPYRHTNEGLALKNCSSASQPRPTVRQLERVK